MENCAVTPMKEDHQQEGDPADDEQESQNSTALDSSQAACGEQEAKQSPLSSPLPSNNMSDDRRLEKLSPVQVDSSLLETKMDAYLLKTLDEMERRTEKLRETVKEAEDERLYLLESLNTLMQSQALVNTAEDERDELELYMDRLTNRLLTIDISVQMIRSPPQEESLRIVRTLLRKLRDNIRQGDAARKTIQGYLNSCMEEASGPVDDRFQGALLGCAAEDQKEIKKKLVAMWEANQDIDRQITILASLDLT